MKTWYARHRKWSSWSGLGWTNFRSLVSVVVYTVCDPLHVIIGGYGDIQSVGAACASVQRGNPDSRGAVECLKNKLVKFKR